MSDLIKVAKVSDVPLGGIREFAVEGVMLAIANLNGQFFAVANICTHDGGPLGEGEVVDGCCVECPRHGARFDLSTGEVKALPATIPIKTYKVKIEGEDILVEI